MVSFNPVRVFDSRGHREQAGADEVTRPKKRGMGLSMTVHFTDADPNIDENTGQRKSLSHLDYSPLRRVTKQSFFMGVLISMGGFL